MIFFGVNGCFRLVIKYSESKIIFKGEDNLQQKNDIEALKYNNQIGLDTLVVYTVNDEY